MARGDVVVYVRDGKWRLRFELGCDLAMEFDSEEDAVETGRSEARRRAVTLVVRDHAGDVAWQESHELWARGIPW